MRLAVVDTWSDGCADNGATVAEAKEKQIYLGQLVQYVERLDQHLTYLTVRETLDFIAANALANPAQFGHPELVDSFTNRVQETMVRC